MLKLIQNEWIKIFSKISTYVLLGLTLLLTMGYSILARSLGAYEPHSYTYNDYDLNSEIAYLESSRPEGYEADVKRYQFMLDNGDSWDMDSWEFNALTEVFSAIQSPLIYQADQLSPEETAALEEKFNALTSAIVSHDFQSYAALWIREIESQDISDNREESPHLPLSVYAGK